MSDNATVLRSLMSPQRVERLEKVISRRLRGVTVLLEELSDHGNIVAIMRTCEALGIQDVHLIELDGQFKPAKKVGHGADKWLTIHVHESAEHAVDHLRGRGYRLLAAQLNASETLRGIELSGPVALVFGGERDGVTTSLSDLCDGGFIIPMVGQTQSLNVSCAAAISLHEISHRYRHSIGRDSDLSAEEAAEVRELFYRRSVRASELVLAKRSR